MPKLKVIPENYKEIKLSNIVVEGWNYKDKDPDLQKKLVSNIKKNGQIENLLVRNLGKGKYGLVNGHHRLDALHELKYTTAFIYDLGKIDIKLAKRIAIETNETKFKSDNLALAEILKDLKEDFDDLEETMPYNEKELENFDALLEFDWDEDTDEDSDDDLGDGSKSETAISAGGDKFKTVKLELEPKLADRFLTQIDRFRDVAGAADKPMEIITAFLESNSDDNVLMESAKSVPRKKSKTKAKKKRRKN